MKGDNSEILFRNTIRYYLLTEFIKKYKVELNYEKFYR